jgi:hypothetical protein
MNDIVATSKIPYLFKRAKVISIIKPGKTGTDPAHYRPISLPSVVYKLLVPLILQPSIEDVTPINQAWTEQVMALTTHIEAGFQHQFKTGAVFVDLTVAYDTILREGLMIKCLEAIPCLKLFNMLNNMLSNRFICWIYHLLLRRRSIMLMTLLWNNKPRHLMNVKIISKQTSKYWTNFFIVGAFIRIQEKLKCAYSTSTRMLPKNNWMWCSTALQSNMSIILNI